MLRKIVLFSIIAICFVLQTTMFQALSFANIAPNLLIIVVSAFGFMRGKKEGMFIGFFCGLLIDIFCGFYFGVYALIYMYIGYVNGLFQKRFYPDDIKRPMLFIAGSDLALNIVTYLLMFLLRRRFHFFYYLKAIILPELVYTMVITIFLYFILLKINQKLEAYEKRRAIKFDL
ncbi:MAG: rod shape-determining protein MreD [Lachnospiraceae bacterium]|nr:rod shape-determining protein MreD [Lachnospiraceae bacterium]